MLLSQEYHDLLNKEQGLTFKFLISPTKFFAKSISCVFKRLYLKAYLNNVNRILSYFFFASGLRFDAVAISDVLLSSVFTIIN
jgi:hypothetical protein